MPEPRPAGDDAPRPEIAQSWHRVRLAGLAPDTRIDRLAITDVDRTSRLMVAAGPVLDEMTEQLADTTLCLALADRDCRIIDMRFTDRRVELALEEISAVPGSRYTEDVSGTNSVSTPYETRSGIAVNGNEHFLEPLKKFSCYGQPILHPVTRRIEGVLDITGVMAMANPLFAPFVQRGVRDIERRLLEGSRSSEQYLLAAFQATAAQLRSRAVVVLGDNLVLANPPAVDLLEAADHALLRTVAPDVPADRAIIRQVRLASGRVVRAEASRITGTGGFRFTLVPTQRPGPGGRPPRRRATAVTTSPVERQLRALRDTDCPVLISGEPGSGRSSAARTIAGSGPVVTLDAAQVPALGEGAWARQLDDLAGRHRVVLAVEDFHLLPAALRVLLGRVLDTSTARIVLTSAPRDQLSAEALSLAARCVSAVDLPPLRARRDELPALARAMLAELCPGRVPRFAPSALTALAGQHWPGNLRELRMVVRHAAASRATGDITVSDLPESHQDRPEARTLTPWEQAEHDAIVAALRATAGNKLHAAERLGISRSTLYNRIRSLKISL
ncbi:MAG: sigma-54-dependent Fis family transcriptional regulator [Haloechinothrix sp.]